jgi:ADP-ribose pyrophosphatase YjhB (NUDIX family)
MAKEGSAEVAPIRETCEESGVEVVLDGPVGVYSHPDVEVIIIVYQGRVSGGEARAGEDATEVGFFAPENLPANPSPVYGTPTDHWFHAVIETVTTPWRKVVTQ